MCEFICVFVCRVLQTDRQTETDKQTREAKQRRNERKQWAEHERKHADKILEKADQANPNQKARDNA